MSRLAGILVALVAAPAAAAVGFWQGQTGDAEAPVAAVRINAPLLGKPGAGVAEAGRYFASLNAPPPPLSSLVSQPPPPPPPDVAVLFRRDLSAVLNSPGPAPRVVLTGSRSLRPGEIYRDGWTLASLSATTAVLTKGKEQRSIGLFSPPPPQTVQTAAPEITIAPQIAFTNGARAGAPAPGQVAAVLTAMRAAGATQQQIDRISPLMSSGTFDRNAASQLVSQLARLSTTTTQQLNALVQAMQRAGFLDANQAAALSQSLQQLQSSQAVQQAMGGQTSQRGGGGGGGGGGGDRSDRGGGNRGGGGGGGGGSTRGGDRPPNSGFGDTGGFGGGSQGGFGGGSQGGFGGGSQGGFGGSSQGGFGGGSQAAPTAPSATRR